MRNGIVKFKVEKGVPLPQDGRGGGQRYEWPFGTMKVGECFFVPIDGTFKSTYQARHTIFRHARLWHNTGRKFTTRLMPDDRRIGVWRIK